MKISMLTGCLLLMLGGANAQESCVQKARLVFYNMQGQELKSFDIRDKGISTIEISRSDLRNGLYFYALITDGLLLETHKMVIE